MLGLNKLVTIIETTRPASDTGSIEEEFETTLLTGIPAALQAHVLNNLPPPPDRPQQGGRFYLQEFRCWLTRASIGAVRPKTTWIVQDEETLVKYRVRAVIDDAGRSHHWLLRMEEYSN